MRDWVARRESERLEDVAMQQVQRGRWRTAHSIALLVIGVMVFMGIWLAIQVRTTHRLAVERELIQQAKAAAQSQQIIERWLAGPSALEPELVQLSEVMDAQVTALTLAGETLADSRRGADTSNNLARMPEVRTALVGGDGQSIRAIDGSDSRWFLVAVPVREGGAVMGVLHLAFPRSRLERDLVQLQRLVVIGTVLASLLITAMVIFFAEQMISGVRRLTQVVEQVAAGDLDARLLSLQRGEVGNLAQAFNRMADKLQSQMKKRAREKARLNTVMHVLTDGVIILNKAGEVKLINPAAARLLHTTEDKAMHRTFVQAARDHRIAEVWSRCQASGEEEVAAVELGPTQFVRVGVTPLIRRVGRGYLVMLQDLTQVRRLQTIRQDFISNVSHELRTPLASLRALVETLRDSALDDPPAARHFLDRMEIEVDALTQMVEELLELSRIESGHVPLQLNPVLPSAAIAPAVDRLRPQAERKQLVMEVDVPRELPLVLIDAGRIHQVVTNLVHNSIKFTPSGGKISVRATADEQKVVICISDTGIGITPNDLPRIFERFFKTDRSRAVGGTGLGLAIAKHIVQAHGGAIWAESMEGQGSAFYFTLPLAEAERTSMIQAINQKVAGLMIATKPPLRPR